MYCKYCGKPVELNAPFCPYCGNPVDGYYPPSGNSYSNIRPVNKWVAFLLCFFLGVFGAHKFFEGKVGMGVLYIFTAGLFGFGWLVDIVTILTKPDPYFVSVR